MVDGPDVLYTTVTLLGAGVLAVPLSKRLGFGSALGYLSAGLLIGPWGLALIHEPSTLLHISELGIILFLFVIGLEMEPSKLWGMRAEIFGLGFAQVGLCILLLWGVGVFLGFSLATALIAGAGFVMTSTAIVMQVLKERSEIGSETGDRVVAILLLEDLAVLPLLALIAFLSPVLTEAETSSTAFKLTIGAGSLAVVLAVGYWGVNPLFRLLERTGPEVVTSAALLLALGAGFLVQSAGLSVAMGAFIAGVVLARSEYKGKVTTEIEPFREILLGLFFLSIGMSLNMAVVWANWEFVVIALGSFMGFKAVGVYTIARIEKMPNHAALERTVLMSQGGEFAFVLYAAALGSGIFNPEENAVLSSVIILSLILTPVLLTLFKHETEDA